MINLNKLKEYYSSSPFVVKKLYSLIPWNIRMGSTYRDTYKFLINTEKWSEVQWIEYQESELRKLLAYSKKHVKYYNRLFDKHNINIEASDIWNEYSKIPYLDKETLRSKEKELITTSISKNKLYRTTTGGSTGTPVGITFSNDSYQKEWAYKVYFWNRSVGYTPQSRKASFRGIDNNGVLYINNPIYNEIRFSPFMLDRVEDLDRIISKVKKYKPRYIHGYPSALYQLAKYMDNKQVSVGKVQGVILVSENIFNNQIELLKKVFKCPVSSFYGHTERVTIASMDNTCDNYYIHPGYGVCHLIDDNDQIIDDYDIKGEIVGTGFTNLGMPLIKYKTDDFACYTRSKSSIWNMRAVRKIQGYRDQEYVYGRNGQKVSLVALNMHSDIFSRLKKVQVYQSEIGRVQLNLVKEDAYTKDDEKELYQAYKNKLGNDFDLTFNYVENIPLTVSGKQKYYINEIKL